MQSIPILVNMIITGPLQMSWSTPVVAETKERIAANLANFAYDPYNYTYLRQVRTPMYAVIYFDKHICLYFLLHNKVLVILSSLMFWNFS